MQPGEQVAAELPLRPDPAGLVRNASIRYLIYLPPDYGQKQSFWPLLLFLHGAGERGINLEAVKAHGPPKLIQERTIDLPFIVVSPQCPDHQRWNAAELIQLVEHVAGSYNVDRYRQYVTGLSMGGFGTWELCSRYPDHFAAAIPICGGGNPNDASVLRMPLWVFHGAKDRIVELFHSQRMVDAVLAAGGNVKFTVYPDIEHHSWTPAYAKPDIYRWLLEQKRPTTH